MNSFLLLQRSVGLTLSLRCSIIKKNISQSTLTTQIRKQFLNSPTTTNTIGHIRTFYCKSGQLLSLKRRCNQYKKINMIQFSSYPNRSMLQRDRNQSIMMSITALVVIVLGLSYAAVPLYRIYCQKTGKGGQAVLENDINEKVASLQKVTDRKLTIRFEAERSSRLAWDFKPSQLTVKCSPGETILAFYTAKNQLDRPVNGIATYTILPYEAGKYFNKIQCFCFEEQQLNPNEEVDLPVFFYIDPEYSKDPYLFESDEIVLSYNFFETKEGYKLPKPPAFKGHFPSLPNVNQSKAQV